MKELYKRQEGCSLEILVALMSSGITDTSLVHHLENAKAHGVTREEAAAIITLVAFYAGWSKGWAAFRLAKDVWKDETAGEDAKAAHSSGGGGFRRERR